MKIQRFYENIHMFEVPSFKKTLESRSDQELIQPNCKNKSNFAMAKAKVKRLNHKEEKKNPFNFRFNKVKHKVVNERQQRVNEQGSNPYQSRNRANELRKKSLLVEYKNKNKTGHIKFVEKKEDPIGNRAPLRQDKNPAAKRKGKDNAEYMSEMFEKKRLAQAERDKTENLRNRVDDQFNALKNSFLSKEFARKELSDSKQVDSYDLIFNDLLVNGGQRYVPRLPTSSSSDRT